MQSVNLTSFHTHGMKTRNPGISLNEIKICIINGMILDSRIAMTPTHHAEASHLLTPATRVEILPGKVQSVQPGRKNFKRSILVLHKRRRF